MMEEYKLLDLPHEVLLKILDFVKSTESGKSDAESFASTCRTLRAVYYLDWQKFHIERMRDSLHDAGLEDQWQKNLIVIFDFCALIALHPKLPANTKLAVIRALLERLAKKEKINTLKDLKDILSALGDIDKIINMTDLRNFGITLTTIIEAPNNFTDDRILAFSSTQLPFENAKSLFNFFISTLEFVPSNKQGQNFIRGVKRQPFLISLEGLKETLINSAWFFIPLLTLSLPYKTQQQLPVSAATLFRLLLAATLLRYIVKVANRMAPENYIKNTIKQTIFACCPRLQKIIPNAEQRKILKPD